MRDINDIPWCFKYDKEILLFLMTCIGVVLCIHFGTILFNKINNDFINRENPFKRK